MVDWDCLVDDILVDEGDGIYGCVLAYSTYLPYAASLSLKATFIQLSFLVHHAMSMIWLVVSSDTSSGLAWIVASSFSKQSLGVIDDVYI
jgi:hypothetical protein